LIDDLREMTQHANGKAEVFRRRGMICLDCQRSWSILIRGWDFGRPICPWCDGANLRKDGRGEDMIVVAVGALRIDESSAEKSTG